MVRKIGVAAATAALLLTAACGDGERPSADEVAKSLKGGKAAEVLGSTSNLLTDKGIDCIAEAIVDSKLSNEAIRALVEGKDKFRGDKGDNKAMTSLQGDIAKCAEGNVKVQ
ncbi:hypothetical protein ABIE44_000060 [Marmoricola sp. OAE513]|uniref:hypothetical protein n=1 Tax=Marmoricola sp. OAE513 TaxID=2817894 RepID=UPI001AEA8741